MKSVQLFLIAAGISFIAWAAADGIVARDYLPPVVAVSQKRTLHYPSYYKPQYYQDYQPSYYPSYSSSYYPQYNGGILGGYQQQSLSSGTSLGLGGLSGLYPNINLELLTAIKPRAGVVDTVYDTNGGYVYGKKK